MNHNNCSGENKYSPYMLGDSPRPMTCWQQNDGSNQNDPGPWSANFTVRDCMNWPSPSSVVDLGGNAYGDSVGEKLSQRASIIQAKVIVPGTQGKEEKYVPCKIAPSGIDPSSLLEPMSPVTFNIKAPSPDPSGMPTTINLGAVTAARINSVNRQFARK